MATAPRKVNNHAWRVIKDRIPTRFNLWFRGVCHNNTLLCPSCGNGIETNFHVISECHVAKKVWNSICKWLDLDLPIHLPPVDFINYVGTMNKKKVVKDIVTTIIYAVWWELWKARNDSIFNPTKRRDMVLVDAIINFSFLWFRYRSAKLPIAWDEWLKNPILCF